MNSNIGKIKEAVKGFFGYEMLSDRIIIEDKISIDENLNVSALEGYALNYKYKLWTIDRKSYKDIRHKITFYLNNTVEYSKFNKNAEEAKAAEETQKRIEETQKRMKKGLENIRISMNQMMKEEKRKEEELIQLKKSLVFKYENSNNIEEKILILKDLLICGYNIREFIIELVLNIPDNTFGVTLLDLANLLIELSLDDYASMVLETIINGDYSKETRVIAKALIKN